MAFRLLLSFLILNTLSFAGSFDKPLTKKVVKLRPSKSNPSATRRKVTCYYYPGFMVKEVDLGEKGAERLSIVPAGKTATACIPAHSKTEK